MKNYLITGASRGLGLKTTELLLESGASVWGVGRTLTNEILQLQNKFGTQMKYLQFDISNIAEIKERIFENFIPNDIELDGLVNNAAIAYSDLATNLKIEQLVEMFNVNVFATMMFSKFAVRRMILHSTKGSIVHISSICVREGFKGLSMYAASKGALEGFSRALAREWGRYGIRSNCVAAGFMQTDMSSSLKEEDLKKIFSRSALKSAVSCDSVAETISFLLSEKSSSISGQIYTVSS